MNYGEVTDPKKLKIEDRIEYIENFLFKIHLRVEEIEKFINRLGNLCSKSRK
jgi:hypothetical protein